MKSVLIGIGNWVEHRLGIVQAVRPVLEHPVPKGLGWWYVFGSSTMTLFILQIVTGICLSLVYVPSTDSAYQSLLYLNNHQILGYILRGMHYWGATLMVIFMLLHLVRVFMLGAYKYPRELTWVLGVILLFLTLAMAFTGQVLRWDADGYWGLAVMTAIAGRVPIIGPSTVHIILGGPIIGAETLTRFFTLHVFVLTGLIMAVLGLHLWLVLKQGISEFPTAGKKLDPATYDKEYHLMLEKNGEPFFPNNILRDGIVSALVVILTVVLAIVLGPKELGAPPDPTMLGVAPRPDWEFMPLFALAALSPPWMEGPLLLGIVPAVFIALVAVPFVSNRGERHPRKRPFAVISLALVAVILIALGVLSVQAPWSPIMNAWKSDVIPPKQLASLTPIELKGATVFQYKQCINCHSIDGVGGLKGPDLTYVADQLNKNQLIRQVIQGGGDMPAFGNELSPSEVRAVVAFMQTLHYGDVAVMSDSPDLHPLPND